jgi:hypothetical protein
LCRIGHSMAAELACPQIVSSLSATDEARRCLHYFQTNRDRMRYPQFHAQGLCTSTGVVEAGCKVAIGTRLKRAGMHWLQLVSRGMTAKTAHFHEFSKFVTEPTTVAARVAFSFPASSIFRSGNVTKNATKILPSTRKLMSLTAQQGRESRSSAFSTSPSDSGLQAHPPQSINLVVNGHLSPWPDRVLRAAARYHSG